MSISDKVALNVVFQTHDWLDETGITYNKAIIVKRFLEDIDSHIKGSYRIYTSTRRNYFSIEVEKCDYDNWTINRTTIFSAKWYLG